MAPFSGVPHAQTARPLLAVATMVVLVMISPSRLDLENHRLEMTRVEAAYTMQQDSWNTNDDQYGVQLSDKDISLLVDEVVENRTGGNQSKPEGEYNKFHDFMGELIGV